MIRSFRIKRLALPFCAILLGLGITPAMAADAHFQFANGFDLATRNDVAGGGTLTRTKDAVWARLALTGLGRKATYTIWWVIFNDPGDCTDPCNADDERSVLYASGFVTGTDGTANVTAHLDAGDPPEGQEVLMPPNPLVVPGGLESENGLQAEIHMIVRTHGDPLAGLVAEQIATFSGACDVNACADRQAIVFSPPHPH